MQRRVRRTKQYAATPWRPVSALSIRLIACNDLRLPIAPQHACGQFLVATGLLLGKAVAVGSSVVGAEGWRHKSRPCGCPAKSRASARNLERGLMRATHTRRPDSFLYGGPHGVRQDDGGGQKTLSFHTSRAAESMNKALPSRETVSRGCDHPQEEIVGKELSTACRFNY